MDQNLEEKTKQIFNFTKSLILNCGSGIVRYTVKPLMSDTFSTSSTFQVSSYEINFFPTFLMAQNLCEG